MPRKYASGMTKTRPQIVREFLAGNETGIEIDEGADRWHIWKRTIVKMGNEAKDVRAMQYSGSLFLIHMERAKTHVFERKNSMRRIKTYAVRIMADESMSSEDMNELREGLPSVMSDVEGQISNQLPEGAYAKIDDLSIDLEYVPNN